MSRIPMDTSKAKILGIIAQNVTAKKDIQLTAKERLGLSYSTIQRLMKQYLADGSLHLKARQYSVTREGEIWLSKRQKTPEMLFRDSKLRDIVDKLPTPHHRAFVYFILSAITAKLYLWDKKDKFWPSFIIGGDTGDIKTLLAEMVCEALKLPLETCIQDTVRKTAPQVLGTFDKIVGGKRTLDPGVYYSYLFICWDDFDKLSDRAVWKALMSYIDGWAYREERGTYIERRHTCLITMNFDTATLPIPEHYIRRAFVINSKGLHCDPKQKEIIGRDIGDALKSLPKLKIEGLPVSFRKLEKADMDFMRDLLYKDLKTKDDARVIDTNFLEKIVLGWLIMNQTGDVRDAIYWAVESSHLFLETQDRMKEGWRGELTTEWGNYQAGVNPDFAKEWEKHLEQVKKNGKVVKDYKKGKEKVVVDKDAVERATLAQYAPELDELTKIKSSFEEMDGGEHKTTLLYLSMDIRKFTSYLPTEKRENKVTEDVLRGLEIVVTEWKEQHKPIREAWEAEQKKIQAYEEQKEQYCRYLLGLKRVLTDYFGRGRKDKNGVLWSRRTQEVREDIGKVLNPKTQKKFFNKPFRDSINERSRTLLAERKEQREGAKGGIKVPELELPGWTEEEAAVVEEAVVEQVGQPSKTTRTVPYWKYLLIKLDRKLKRGERGKPRPRTIDEQIDYEIRGGKRPYDPLNPTQRNINDL